MSIKATDDGVNYIPLDGSTDRNAPVAVPKSTTAMLQTFLPPAGSPILLCWGPATFSATVTNQAVAVPLNPTATNPTAFDDALTYLFVESLFQPGARTEIGPTDRSSGDPLPPSGLLALVRLSLRPKFVQRMRYESYTITGLSTAAPTSVIVPPGAALQVTINTTNADAWYMVQTGTPGIPTPIPPSPPGQPTTLKLIMPKEGRLFLLLQGLIDGSATIAKTVWASDASGTNKLAVEPVEPFGPTDFRSAYFAVPGADATIPPSNVPPWSTSTGPEGHAWTAFGGYLSSISAGQSLPDPTSNDMSDLLSWLDRFFEEGGDVGPLDNSAAAATLAGPWAAAAYPRSSTPIALKPDSAGRITYYQPIEDLWGHTYRYFLRPQGRYDRLWSALSFSPGIFSPASVRGALGVIAANQCADRCPRAGRDGRGPGADQAARGAAGPLVAEARPAEPAGAVGPARGDLGGDRRQASRTGARREEPGVSQSPGIPPGGPYPDPLDGRPAGPERPEDHTRQSGHWSDRQPALLPRCTR